jgi:hypothetical protein
MLNDERFARFKHNLSLEYAMYDFFGQKEFSGMAASFRESEYCKKTLLKSIKRIRSRLSEIPMDERLIQNTGNILDSLEKNVDLISDDVNTDWT